MSSCTSRPWLCQEQGPQQNHTPPTGSDRDRGFEADGSLPLSFPPQGLGGTGDNDLEQNSQLLGEKM